MLLVLVGALKRQRCNSILLNLLRLKPNKQRLIQFADLLSCCHQSIHLNFWVFILKGTFISIEDQLSPEIPSKTAFLWFLVWQANNQMTKFQNMPSVGSKTMMKDVLMPTAQS